MRRKTKGGICCAPGQKSALPSARAASLAKCAYDKNADEAFRGKRMNERVARRREACPQRLSFATLPDSPMSPIGVSERLFVAVPRFRSLSFSEPPRASRARSRLDIKLHAAFFRLLSLCQLGVVFPRSVVLFRQASARAIFGFASARARPQRTTRRFRRTSGRRRRSPRRPTEPPAPGASVSARLLAARRFARVRVGSRVGKRAS